MGQCPGMSPERGAPAVDFGTDNQRVGIVRISAQSKMAALVVGVVLSVATGCGAASSGRLGVVRNVPGKWDVWVPSSGDQLYVRIREPVTTGLGSPCPGVPWGVVNRYRLDSTGRIVYPPGGPRDQYEAALEHAVKGADNAPKPPWMKAFDKKCRAR